MARPAAGLGAGQSLPDLHNKLDVQGDRVGARGRGTESGDQPMQAACTDQSRMSVAPDCGETSYRGSGKLLGKVAIISGGDSGIGRAVAIAFAREGAHVLINYRRHDQDAADTEAACRQPQPCGPMPASYPLGRAFLHRADISSREACHALVQEALTRYSRLDCVVHNAGVQYPEDGMSHAVGDHIEEVMKVNTYPFVWLAEAALPALKDSQGCLIANTSVIAYKGSDSLISYSASKGALKSLVESYAQVCAKDRVRVNAVAPGPIWTPFISGTFPTERIHTFGQNTPMGRAGQPCECAPAFVFLASADASYITGHALHVDGGMWTSD